MAQPKAWRTRGSRTLFEHPRLNLVEDTLELPTGEEIAWLRYEGLQDFVSVLCLRRGEVLVIYQYNPPTEKVVAEFPGGIIDAGESPEAAARREVEEEVGLRLAQLHPLGSYFVNPRRAAIRCHVFCGEGVEEVAARPEPTEFIASEWLSADALEARMRDGRIENVNLLAAWALYRLGG